MFIKLLTFTASALLLVGGQSATAKDHAHPKTDTRRHAGYVKPGAAVELSHDYDGKTQLGEFETITATLSHIYENGALTVTLLASPELHVSAFASVKDYPIYQGSTFDLSIQFSGMAKGTYTLSLEVVYESPMDQQSRRVLSIPVNIGGADIEKSTTSAHKDVAVISKFGVIGLAAIEVIE